MIYRKDIDFLDYAVEDSRPVSLLRVPKGHPLFVKWFIEHYPGSKGLVGRQLNYLILSLGIPVGIITVSSPPRNYKPFRQFLGVEDSQYLNNSVFRIVVPTGDKNFGTKVLKILRHTAIQHYKETYGDTLVGLGTFVEPPRTGSIYRADNWIYLGVTQGVHVTRRGKSWLEKSYEKGVPKLIFARFI